MKYYLLKPLCLGQLKLFAGALCFPLKHFIHVIYTTLHLYINIKMNCQLNYYRKHLQVDVNCEEQPLKFLKFWDHLCQDATAFSEVPELPGSFWHGLCVVFRLVISLYPKFKRLHYNRPYIGYCRLQHINKRKLLLWYSPVNRFDCSVLNKPSTILTQ